MDNPIDRVFCEKERIKLMTHIVAGYPDLEKSFEIALAMAEGGADLLEIQIPFSDPIADGLTIMEANSVALLNGATPPKCFQLAKRLVHKVKIPLLFMTYANIPFHMGIAEFVRKSAECGISGLIIPDLTFDEKIEGYLEHADRFGVYPINVVSPDIKEKRLEKIMEISKGFIYITLRVGITGEVKRIEETGMDFLRKVRKKTQRPIAAGFGISSTAQVKQLEGLADAVVVGSHVIHLYKKSGLSGMERFIDGCRSLKWRRLPDDSTTMR